MKSIKIWMLFENYRQNCGKINISIRKDHQKMKNVSAKEFMRSPVVSVTRDTYLRDIIKIIDEEGFSGLPVVDDDHKVIGIISETDIRKYTRQVIGQPLRDHDLLLEEEADASYVGSQRGVDIIEFVATVTAQNLMTASIIAVTEDTSIIDIVKLIVENKVNRIPVIDENGKLTGIIARHDVLKMLYEHF